MEEINKRRVARLEELLAAAPISGSQIALGRLLGHKSGAQVYQWLQGLRAIGEKSARSIERRVGKPHGWMDGEGAHSAVIAALEGLSENQLERVHAFIEGIKDGASQKLIVKVATLPSSDEHGKHAEDCPGLGDHSGESNPSSRLTYYGTSPR